MLECDATVFSDEEKTKITTPNWLAEFYWSVTSKNISVLAVDSQINNENARPPKFGWALKKIPGLGSIPTCFLLNEFGI